MIFDNSSTQPFDSLRPSTRCALRLGRRGDLAQDSDLREAKIFGGEMVSTGLLGWRWHAQDAQLAWLITCAKHQLPTVMLRDALASMLPSQWPPN